MVNLKELLCGSTQRMSSVYRYSGLPHRRPENVAEHSYYVVLYSLIIAKDLEKRKRIIDYKKVLTSAVLHDLDEALTGDIVRSVKYSHPKLKSLLDEVAATCCKETLNGLSKDLYPYWRDAKDTKTIEGCIVQLADFLSVMAYCIERIESGNRKMQSVLKGAYENFGSKMNHSVYNMYKKQIKDLVTKYSGNVTKEKRIII